jgi:hypothetical protein
VATLNVRQLPPYSPAPWVMNGDSTFAAASGGSAMWPNTVSGANSNDYELNTTIFPTALWNSRALPPCRSDSGVARERKLHFSRSDARLQLAVRRNRISQNGLANGLTQLLFSLRPRDGRIASSQ